MPIPRTATKDIDISEASILAKKTRAQATVRAHN
jgi:hypothetical protein